MKTNNSKSTSPATRLPKCPTGIQGLDEITGGGLPRGRPTLVCGGAGCGKTLLAAEFLVRGAVQFDEPGVLMAFEETEAELKANVASLGFDLAGLVRRKKIVIDYVHIERSEVQESGEYDLEGLFVRLGHAIDSIGAKRVVLDTLEALFASLPNEAILRAELRRLFRWLKDKGVTAVITAERGREQLTRHGLEEYVSDCVILLDHRVYDQIATRHLRVVKYRGALHGTNEFPFLIGDDGISVLPITSLALNHKVSNERIATGIPRLDAMLGGRGFFRGSSILLTGTLRHRQDHHRRQLCPGRRPARGARALLLVRGIAQPNHPQHAFHRVAPGTAGQARLAAVSLGAALALRPGNAPGHDVQGDRRVSTRRRHHGPDYQPDGLRHRLRRQGDGDAAD
jgi:circadian clock protein KaiC